MKQKAGVVLHRTGDTGETEVLLVSAKKHPGSWVFPVGTVEPGETRAATATRECAEESGYRVTLGAQLREPITARAEAEFTFFLATVAGTAPTWETEREQRWVRLGSLVDHVPDVFKAMATDAVRRLDGRIGDEA